MAYRMTPKRRAALRKAQLASARKRRRRIGLALAGGVGVLAAGGVGVLAAAGAAGIGVRYAQGLKGGPARPHVPGKELVHVPGHGVTYTKTVVRRKMRRRKPPKAHGHKVWKVDVFGQVEPTRFNADNTKRRNIYNQNRRRKYWRSKPVGGRRK